MSCRVKIEEGGRERVSACLRPFFVSLTRFEVSVTCGSCPVA
jgi:hypothetical protein